MEIWVITSSILPECVWPGHELLSSGMLSCGQVWAVQAHPGACSTKTARTGPASDVSQTEIAQVGLWSPLKQLYEAVSFLR